MKRQEEFAKGKEELQAKAILSTMNEEIIPESEMELTEGGGVTNNCENGNCVSGCSSSGNSSNIIVPDEPLN